MLDQCPSLRHLRCSGPVPRSYPAQLESLRVALDRPGPDSEEWVWETAGAVLRKAGALQQLRSLHLDVQDIDDVCLSAAPPFSSAVQLPALQRFGLSCRLQGGWYHSSAEHSFNLSALASFQGTLDLRFAVPLYTADERKALWRALQALPCIQRLGLWFKEDAALDSTEQQLLQSLSVHAARVCWAQGQDMPQLRCSELCVIVLGVWKVDQVVLSWSELGRAEAGTLYIVVSTPVLVEGFDGRRPGVTRAVVLDVQADGQVQGLPVDRFKSGPDGLLVWQDGSVSEQQLLALRPEKAPTHFDW